VAQVDGELLQRQVFVVHNLREEVVLADEGTDVLAEQVQLVESELVTVVNGVAFPVVEAVPCLLRESYTRHQG
jgi:uncharacterized protein YbaR (Trm112 family)